MCVRLEGFESGFHDGAFEYCWSSYFTVIF